MQTDTKLLSMHSFDIHTVNIDYDTWNLQTWTQMGWVDYIYTVSQKKLCHFYFYCNFGKCWSIFKILLLSESEGNSW